MAKFGGHTHYVGRTPNIQKPLECANKCRFSAPPKNWVLRRGAEVRHLHRPSPIQGVCHWLGYNLAALATLGIAF